MSGGNVAIQANDNGSEENPFVKYSITPQEIKEAKIDLDDVYELKENETHLGSFTSSSIFALIKERHISPTIQVKKLTTYEWHNIFETPLFGRRKLKVINSDDTKTEITSGIYVLHHGNREGPYTHAQITKMLAQGEILYNDMISTEDNGWQKVCDYKQFDRRTLKSSKNLPINPVEHSTNMEVFNNLQPIISNYEKQESATHLLVKTKQKKSTVMPKPEVANETTISPPIFVTNSSLKTINTLYKYKKHILLISTILLMTIILQKIFYTQDQTSNKLVQNDSNTKIINVNNHVKSSKVKTRNEANEMQKDIHRTVSSTNAKKNARQPLIQPSDNRKKILQKDEERQNENIDYDSLDPNEILTGQPFSSSKEYLKNKKTGEVSAWPASSDIIEEEVFDHEETY